MLSVKKFFGRWYFTICLGGVGLMFVSAFCFAIFPALVIPWLLTANNLMIADIAIGLTGTLAGWLWYECGNGFSFSACKTTAPTSNSQAYSKQPVTVLLKPSDKRKNPDPNQWQDDAASRDVVPKTQTTPPAKPSTVIPNTYPLILDAIGAPAQATYAETSATANTYRDIATVLAPAGGYASLPSFDDAGRAKTFNRVNPDDSATMQVVYTKSVSLSCPTGYTLGTGKCNLNDVTVPKKPITTSCEVLFANGQFTFDARNPNCDGLEAKLKTDTADSKKIKVISQDSSGNKEGWSMTPNSSGGFDVCQDKGSGSITCLSTAGYDSGQSGYPITGTTQTPGTIIGGGSSTGTGTTTGTGTGTTTGTGTGTTGGTPTGTGTGDCTGYGCAKESTQQDVLSELKKFNESASSSAWASADFDPNARVSSIVSDLNSKFKKPEDYAGITSSITSSLGLPPGGQCSNAILNASLFGRSMVIDFTWLCTPIAPIVNWFFWVLVILSGVSEIYYILTGRGLNSDNVGLDKS